MAIVYRQEKGSELTFDEVDNNFAELKVSLDNKKPNFAVLPVSQGGTGQNSIENARVALRVPENASDIIYTPAGTGAVATDVQTALRETVSVKRFGAMGDGVTDDTAAIMAALVYVKINKKSLFFPSGDYYFSSYSTTYFDLSGYEITTVKLFGEGPGRTRLLFPNVSSSIALHILSNSDWYDLELSGMSIIGSTSEPLMCIGRNEYTDPLNVARFSKLAILNSSNSTSSIALRLNYVVNSIFENVRANCYATGTGVNKGIALQCRQAAFNTFVNCSFGNAAYGVRFVDGFSYGNTFVGGDYENVDYCVSTDSSSAGNNTMIGGQFSLWEVAAFSRTGSLNTNALTVINPNFGDDDADAIIDQTNFEKIKIIDGTSVVTPDVPASAVPVENKSGKTVMVTIWSGTISQILVEDFSYSMDGGTVCLLPGESISITYSIIPQWVWKATC